MSLFDLSGAVAMMSDKPALTVTRYGVRGVDVRGKANGASSSTFSTAGSFQPVSSKLNREALGFTNKDVLWDLFCNAELKNGDRITDGSKQYQVEQVLAWNSLGNYCEALTRELGTGEI